MKKLFAVWIIGLLLSSNCLGLQGFPDAGQENQSLAVRVTERVTKEINAEIAVSHLADLQILIEQYANFFELDRNRVSKLRVLAKGLVEQHSKEYPNDMIARRWNSINQQLSFGSTFTINGRTCVLDGEEKDVPFVHIRVGIIGKISLMSLGPNERMNATSLLSADKPFLPQENPKWLKAIAPLDETDIERFKEYRLDLLKKMVSRLLLSAIESDLRLSESQIPIVQKWIDDSIAPIDDGNFVSIARKSVAQLSDQAPEELSQTQKDFWPFVKLRLTKR